jgi:uncharacterized tellurite resistance protein B-like protein
MSIADFYESGEQKQNKAQLENLISVALVDGNLADSEKELLGKFAKRLSVDNDTFNEMLKGADNYAINPPYDKEERYKRLYNLVKVALADSILDDKEAILLSKYATGLGYSETQSNELISKTLKLVTDGVDFDDAFETI